MKNVRKMLGMVIVGLATGLIVLTAMGARGEGGRITGDRNSVIAPDRNEVFISATNIIRYPDGGDSIGRFDTHSGAIYRFRGDVRNPSVRNTWETRVPAVKQSTSGHLEIQQIRPSRQHELDDSRPLEPVTFLVDIESGDTWILRLLPNLNGRWDPVPIYR